MRRILLIVGAVVLVAIALFLYRDREPAKGVILATTTSTQDSGLLDVLVPIFEAQTKYTVRTIAVGTGQALATGARGEADVVLVHAPELEEKYVAQGVFVNRRAVMHNDFIVVGPADDPGGIRGMERAAPALARIAEAGVPFVSRGDNSGTHLLEKKLWQVARIEPKGAWYIEAGQGMGATLMIASEKRAYTLTDRGTYLPFKEKVQLEPMVEGDPIVLNLYHVMEVNPAQHRQSSKRLGRTSSAQPCFSRMRKRANEVQCGILWSSIQYVGHGEISERILHPELIPLIGFSLDPIGGALVSHWSRQTVDQCLQMHLSQRDTAR